MKKAYIAPVAYDVYGESLLGKPGGGDTGDILHPSVEHPEVDNGFSKQDVFVWDDDLDAADDDFSYGW